MPAIATAPTVRVLIVDDSAFMRRAIERLLNNAPGITVVGTAADGVEGAKRALELRPDVITMDVEMPRMDGVSAVGEIMRTTPVPIVMLSTLTVAGAETTIRALEAGAVDCVAKPSGLSHELANVGERLAETVIRASHAKVRRRLAVMPLHPPMRPGGPAREGVAAQHLIVIGSSTGGPPALTQVVPHLPGDLNAGVLVVQHMPAGFTAALAKRLDSMCPLHVVEATDGQLITPGRVLVAPGDYHMVVGRDHAVHLTQTASMHGVRPAIDVTLDSAVEVFGRAMTVAILTGMGRDGAEGAARVEKAGGQIIVQDEATSVVYGMPRVAKEQTQHALEVPIDRVATAVVRAYQSGSHLPGSHLR